MRSTWHDLPTELLHYVYSKLDNEDITTCLCVCPQWQRVALTQLYRNVTIKNKKQLEKFVHTMATSTYCPGQYITDLYVADDFEDELQHPVFSEDGEPLDKFSQIVKYAPHLEAFSLSRHSTRFWQRMAAETSQGKLSHINFFQHPNREKEFDSYHKVILNLSKTMTDIAIYDTRAMDQYDCEVLFQKLPEFERLLFLTLAWKTRMALAVLDKTIDALPKLHVLTLKVDSADEPSTFDHDPSFALKPHNTLYKLTVSALLNSEDVFLYIIEKFPRLIDLDISALEDLPLSPRPPVFSNDTMDRLTEYISKLREFSFKNIQFENIYDLIDRVLDPTNNLAVDLWLYQPSQFFKNVCVLITRHQKDQASELNFEIQNTTYPIFLQRLGGKLHSLNIDCATESEVFITAGRDLILSPEVVHFDFGDIITTCSQVKTVTVNDGIFFDVDSEGPQNNSITSMVFKTCECTDGFLANLSIRLPRLNRIEFKHVILCYSENNLQEEHSSHVMRFHMPQTSFHVFVIKDSNLVEHSDYLYLKVILSLGERYYKLSEREASLVTPEEYSSAQGINNPVLSIEIACRSIEQIQLYDSTRHVQINHTLHDIVN
ncbi:hypothetical protein EDC96DRAFT_515279 [Choanephora cucurbitarum]|nr:hypothetical protein EDC96DRAFT_515279 [Choanephora cucurbitarum]